MYEKRYGDAVPVVFSKYRPTPPSIASSKKTPLVQKLRWGYDISILQPAGLDDSESYLSYREVKQRDSYFNVVFGNENNHRWLAVSKDVPGLVLSHDKIALLVLLHWLRVIT